MRTGRRSLTMLLAMALAVGWSGGTQAVLAQSTPGQAASSPSATSAPDAGDFPTPEDAIREYMAGVAQADVGRILRASAISEVSDGFRLAQLTDLMRTYRPIPDLAPSESPFYAEINRARRSETVLSQVLMLAYSLLSTEEIGAFPMGVDEGWGTDFIEQVDPSRLAALEIVDIRFANSKYKYDIRYLDHADESASIFGADELTERLVLFSFEGSLYDLGFTLMRYGDTWKVFLQTSRIGKTDSLGVARPTTIEEYDRLTSGS